MIKILIFIRSLIFAFLLLPLITLLGSLVVIFSSQFNLGIENKIILFWSRSILFLCGVKVVTHKWICPQSPKGIKF